MPVPSIFDKSLIPVIAAPMFLVSNEELVIAAAKAGVAGTFPALNRRTTEGFEEWVISIGETLDAYALENPEKPLGPWGVNLIVHRTNPRMRADLEICVKHEVPLIITSLGAVKEVVEAVHGYGGVVFHDVTNRRHAKKAIEAGVDGLILVTGGAGGHAGTTNPFALLADIRSIFDGTIILAGSISRGGDVAAAIAMGADLAYMGTRFIATEESNADPEYKTMLCEARPEDIVHTPRVSGVPANFMRQSLAANGYDMDQLTQPGDVDFGEKLTVDEEAQAWKTVWSAGHGVAAIDDIPTVGALVAELQRDYEAAIDRLVATRG